MKILWKKFYFDAAHYLPHYEGKCHNIHGHRWRVDIGVTGSVVENGSSKGMIIDFHDLKELVSPIFELLDHQLLNEQIENPTAENITDWLMQELMRKFDDHYYLDLVGLRIYESPDSYIEWRREDASI